jgi:hypothetical protein
MTAVAIHATLNVIHTKPYFMVLIIYSEILPNTNIEYMNNIYISPVYRLFKGLTEKPKNKIGNISRKKK